MSSKHSTDFDSLFNLQSSSPSSEYCGSQIAFASQLMNVAGSCGGGLVVTVLAFYSVNPSSNHIKVLSFNCVIFLKRTKINNGLILKTSECVCCATCLLCHVCCAACCFLMLIFANHKQVGPVGDEPHGEVGGKNVLCVYPDFKMCFNSRYEDGVFIHGRICYVKSVKR